MSRYVIGVGIKISAGRRSSVARCVSSALWRSQHVEPPGGAPQPGWLIWRPLGWYHTIDSVDAGPMILLYHCYTLITIISQWIFNGMQHLNRQLVLRPFFMFSAYLLDLFSQYFLTEQKRLYKYFFIKIYIFSTCYVLCNSDEGAWKSLVISMQQ